MKRGWHLNRGPEVSRAPTGSHFPETGAFQVHRACEARGTWGLGTSRVGRSGGSRQRAEGLGNLQASRRVQLAPRGLGLVAIEPSQPFCEIAKRGPGCPQAGIFRARGSGCWQEGTVRQDSHRLQYWEVPEKPCVLLEAKLRPARGAEPGVTELVTHSILR